MCEHTFGKASYSSSLFRMAAYGLGRTLISGNVINPQWKVNNFASPSKFWVFFLVSFLLLCGQNRSRQAPMDDARC